MNVLENRKIIGFLGNKQSGKDTAGNYLVNKYNYTRYAFGDPVKQICKNLFSLTDDQLNDNEKKETVDTRWGIKPREMFQRIGTEFGQFGIFSIFPEIKTHIKFRELWTKLFLEWFEKEKQNPDTNNCVVITDVRFKHEIECIKKLGGIIVKINRKSNNIDQHSSEQELATFPKNLIDYEIDNNNSLVDLYSQLDTIIYVPF